jgi:hypothetical protein
VLNPVAQCVWPMLTAPAWPGARRARPAACWASLGLCGRDSAARRASACQCGHRSLGAHHGAAGGGAIVAKVEQRWRLSTHGGEATRRAWGWRRYLTGAPRRRGGGGKPDWQRRSLMRRRLRWPAAVLRRGDGGRVSGGGGAETTTAPGGTTHLAWGGRQRRRQRGARTASVSFGQQGGSFGPGDGTVGMSAHKARQRRGSNSGGAVGTLACGPERALKARERCMRHGHVAARGRRRAARQARRGKRRLTGRPHSSVFSELNLLPYENSST